MDESSNERPWLDSFDKLIEPAKPVLREQNLLKENVRISFNIDSSVENSRYDRSESIPKEYSGEQYLSVSKQLQKSIAPVSTPLAERNTDGPFLCKISPIRNWATEFLESKIEKNSNSFQINGLLGIPRLTSDVIVQKQKRRVNFNISSENKVVEPVCKISPLKLQPGKWRKSLSLWKKRLRSSVGKHQLEKLDSIVSNLSVVNCVAGRRKSTLLPQITSRRTRSSIVLSETAPEEEWKKQVLKQCRQRKPLDFEKWCIMSKIRDCRKIGEGVYGEVFLNKDSRDIGQSTVFKVIPIEGETDFNGEPQKTFQEIFPEIAISLELSNLRLHHNSIFATSGFVSLKKVSLVQGKYPENLVKLWEIYDEEKNSENDHPKVFTNEQLYIVFELEFAGEDLATYKFTSAEQTFYALKHIALSMAIAEEVYEFEHRDLHWGNVLIMPTEEAFVTYKYEGRKIELPTLGVRTTIIDYTLSRMCFQNHCLYNDLSVDEDLFTATGDYQYDIYRMMRSELNNDWSCYKPKTNIFWLSYIASKMINDVNYQRKGIKAHKSHIKKLKDVQKIILNFGSAAEFAASFDAV